jgi:hypothetical protein
MMRTEEVHHYVQVTCSRLVSLLRDARSPGMFLVWAVWAVCGDTLRM